MVKSPMLPCRRGKVGIHPETLRLDPGLSLRETEEYVGDDSTAVLAQSFFRPVEAAPP